LSFESVPDRLVECVPNFSEGRDEAVIRAVAAAADETPGVRVLNVDSSPDAHRTVLTFAGGPEACLDAGFRTFKAATGRIDITRHRGVHPRIGALDVFPFVPLRNVDMAECAALAVRLAERVGNELGIPAYLYEEAARSKERKSLSALRAGGTGGLAERMADPAWVPDFGPRTFDPRAGASAIGARGLLIAYNVNLADPDPAVARRVAGLIRESGTGGKPGLFKACRAIGWRIESRGRSQVSTNLTDFRVTAPHAVYEACVRLAAEAGGRVTGSEIVGLVPLEALTAAGRHFGGAGAASGRAGADETEAIGRAVEGLGLNDWAPFDPDRKILERRLAGRP
jgi:glutamate formiminotransferase / formiminotetrahydrofolate cyclodeaminase